MTLANATLVGSRTTGSPFRETAMKRMNDVMGYIASLTMTLSVSAATIVDDSGTARNGKVGHWSSIVARGGDVAISYYCEDDMGGTPPSAFALRFAWANGTSWQWTTVDSYFAGSDTSMARGTDGQYQIVYQSWNGIGWARGSAANWNVVPVDIPAGVVPANISMVLDHNDRPHVAYMNLANGGDRSLRYTFYDGTQWVAGGTNGGIVGVDLWRPTIGFSNTYLQLDAGGMPHIAFAQPSDPVNVYGTIRYATLQGGAGGTWQTESLGVMGQDPSLAIGADNVPRIAFNGAAGLTYAYKTGATWSFETILPGQWGSSVSMALSDADEPVLSFGLGVAEDMYMARRGPGGWTVTWIDGDGASGPHEILGRYGTSVDVDETGVAHVSYLAIDIYSTTWRGDLRYFGPGAGPGPCVNIVTAPAPSSPCEGATAMFSVQATSTDPLAYQWRQNGGALVDGVTPAGSLISGATTPTLSIDGVTPADEGLYDCVVSADCGSATSRAAALAIAQPATILTPPHSTSICRGGTALFSVSGAGAAPAYQWYREATPLSDGPTGSGSMISGATTSSLTINNVGTADAGSYSCSVSNDCGSDSSAPAVLTVRICDECAGDLDGDGSVGLSDLAILLSHFGDSGDVTPDDGDLDGDGDVDLSDLAEFLSHFGTICP